MQQAVNDQTLNAFVGRVFGELSAAATAPMVRLGDRLGLYKALREAGPANSEDLAERTGCAERYVREWLAQQAASAFVTYDPATGRFSLTPEQAMVLAADDSPVSMLGAFDAICAMHADLEKVEAAFRTGRGVGWGDHSRCLFCAVERLFRPDYASHVVPSWLPSLDGVVEKLERGARVADIGCGHGVSTVLMARAFPNSSFVGFDFHARSVEHARDLARASGVEANTEFETAAAKTFPGGGYDLITVFDALHDMGDPIGAAAYIREALAPDGTLMVVEPNAADRLEDNFTPVGRMYYAASTVICVPTSLNQEVGLALGAQAGEARLRGVLEAAGFARVRRTAETPFNMVLEARR